MVPKKQSAWRSPWVLGWIVLVVVVLFANGLMIFLAADNKPGLVVEDYYERGQAYERHILERQSRDPGWLMQIEIPKTLYKGKQQVVRFTVVDKSGDPVIPDRVTLYAYRPSDARQDFSEAMIEESAGIYRTTVAFPLKGVWDTLVSAKLGEAEYNKGMRVMVSDAE